MNHPDGSVRRHFSLFNGVSRFPDCHIASPVRTFHRRRVPLTRFSSTAAAATHNVHRRQSVVRGAGRPPRLAPRRVALAGVRRRRSAQAFRRQPVLRREVSVLLHACMVSRRDSCTCLACPTVARPPHIVCQADNVRRERATHGRRRVTRFTGRADRRRRRKERKKTVFFLPASETVMAIPKAHAWFAEGWLPSAASNTTCVPSRRRDTSHNITTDA